ncbi:MAG: flagellar hook-basal body complex protein [Campylobacterota bacterium]|nr:flagellar hook-basal body complex protein [Campylobacterota bacterium]
MNQAFYSGLTGMQSHQTGIDVTTDNLASINTVGFRGYTTEFSTIFDDAMSQYENTNNSSESIGYGTYVNAISMNEEQGSLILTDSNTDLAIDGEGWFGVLDGQGETLYTRAGSFTFDANYNLVSRDNGMFTLGTLGNNIQNSVLSEELKSVALNDVDAQVPLSLPKNLTYPSQETTETSFSGNLGIDDIEQRVGAKIISADGDVRELRLIFTQVQPQPAEGTSWNINASILSLDGETQYSQSTGTVQFGSDGGLIQNTLTEIDNEGTLIAIDLGEGHNGLIAQGHEKVSLSSSSNGLAYGELIGYSIGQNGQIDASFSNGRSSAVGNIALYHFTNDRGLDRYSGTHFSESNNSGKPIFYKDANGNFSTGSTILNHNLENSNVRMEMGMTELIILQRAYSANAKSITTGDELIQKALQMDA